MLGTLRLVYRRQYFAAHGSMTSRAGQSEACRPIEERAATSGAHRNRRDTPHHLALVPTVGCREVLRKPRPDARPGRPRVHTDVAELINRMASENPRLASRRNVAKRPNTDVELLAKRAMKSLDVRVCVRGAIRHDAQLFVAPSLPHDGLSRIIIGMMAMYSSAKVGLPCRIERDCRRQ